MAERVSTIYHSLSGDGKKVNSLTVDCQSVNPCLAGRQVCNELQLQKLVGVLGARLRILHG